MHDSAQGREGLAPLFSSPTGGTSVSRPKRVARSRVEWLAALRVAADGAVGVAAPLARARCRPGSHLVAARAVVLVA